MNQFFKLTFTLTLSIACISAHAGDRKEARKEARQEARQEWKDNNPEKFSLNFSIGGYPSYELTIYGKEPINSGLVPWIYSDYRGAVKTTGIIGGEFNWNISRWFNASGYLGVCPIWNDTYDGITGAKNGRHSCVSIHIMPKAKVMWCNNPLVRVYTSFAFGVSLYPGFRSEYFSALQPALQLNPVGLEVGRKWFGLMELGAGTSFFGARVGVGYKF